MSIKGILLILLVAILIISILTIFILNMPSFEKIPNGKRAERIKKSPNYKNGKFQNLEDTPQLTSDKSFIENAYNFFFKKVENLRPIEKIPTVKTNLNTLENNSLVWLGHSSYFLKINDKNILIDPVLHSASPFSFLIAPFDTEYQYSEKDLPEDIDLLIITHDHWDHLDYHLMKQIRSRIKRILTTLGVGSHFEYWNFSPEIITELDWNEDTMIENLKFTCLPARHFSGRGILGKQTLWGAFMLQTEEQTIYIGGDSGYGKHIAEIAQRFPKIDFALMENGQYSIDWQYIHFLPEDLKKAMKELNAEKYFTGHNSKFALSKHAWYEPLENISKIAEKEKLNILTPKIGEIVQLCNKEQSFEKWWKKFIK